MSQDPEEINAVEQWKWTEMQGLELVPTAPIPEPSHKSNPPSPPLAENGDSKAEEALSKTEPMETESSEPKKDGGGGGGAANGTGSSSSSGEKPETLPSVGFGELFRFADGLDCILMAIGTAGAVVHGCALPLFLRFFADLVNSFGANANNVDKMTQEVVKV